MRRNPHAGHRASGGLSLNIFTDDELERHPSGDARGAAAHRRLGRRRRGPRRLRRRRRRGRPRAPRSCASRPRRRRRDPLRAADDQPVRPHAGQRRRARIGPRRLHQLRRGHQGHRHRHAANCASRPSATSPKPPALIDALPEIDVLERPVGRCTTCPRTRCRCTTPRRSSPTPPSTSSWAPSAATCSRRSSRWRASSPAGADKLRRRPLVSFITCPVSPLKLVQDCCEIIMGVGTGRRDGQRAQHGHGRRLVAGHRCRARSSPTTPRCWPASRWRQLTERGRAGDLRQLDDRHGPASGLGLGRQPRVRPDQRGRGPARPLLPAAQLGRRCVGRRQTR